MDLVDEVVENFAAELPHIDHCLLEAVSRIIATARILEDSAAETLKQYELAYTDFDVLGMLRTSGPPYELSPAELLRFTLVTSGSMTSCIDRLEKAELVERRINEADRRGRIVALTRTGRDLIERALDQRYAAAQPIMQRLDTVEVAQMNALMKKLVTGD